MRKILLLYFLLFLLLPIGAQETEKETKKDSLSFMSAWTLSQNFSQKVEVELDTNLPGFQIFNPIYTYSYSNSYLSNIGTPVVPNVFADRKFHYDAFFINPYMPYFADAERTRFYNTTKPFSRLLYTTSGPNENREQSFEALHTQNITPKLNFSLRYNVISSKGQYRYQQLKKNTFDISTNYLGDRYSAHASFGINRIRHDESGGVDKEIFESGFIDKQDNYLGEKSIPAKFNGSGNPKYESYAGNKARYYDFMVSQRLKLFTIASTLDTTKVEKARNIAEPILTYTFRMNRAVKHYMHSNPNDSLYYENTYYNYSNTYDSASHFRMANAVRLEFKSTFRGKVQAGIYGGIGNEYENYHLSSQWDTTFNPIDSLLTPIIVNGDTLSYQGGYNRSRYNSNFYFEAGIYGNVLNRFKARFTGKIYFIGLKAGQTNFEGWLSSKFSLFNKEFMFDVSAGIENRVPSYLLNTYYSNHYIWDKELKSEIRTLLSGKISAPSNYFSFRANYYLLSNFIYFNESTIPTNYDQSLNVLSLELAKTFKLWKLRSENKIAYQLSENTGVLPLPDLVVFNSTYIDHTFHFKSTGGDLQLNVGFDVYYTTKFEGYEYSPAIAQFYVPSGNQSMIGNTPIVDAFASLKLKSTLFFIKASHFYGRWVEQNFYSAIGYPYNRYALKFGFSWTFYD